MPMPAKELPDKICKICGKRFNRRRFGTRLEDATRYLKRKTCSQSCGNSKKEPSHRTTFGLRAKRLRKTYCDHCGSTMDLDAHHLDGNIKNNDPKNVRTLCHPCHMKLHWQQNPSFGGTSKRSPQKKGWTALDASEMPSSQRKSTRSSKRSRILKTEQSK